MNTGHDLLILPFDHRSSFSKDLLGYEGELNKKQHAEVTKLKEIVFDALASVVETEKHRGDFGILLDEEYGSALLKKAKKLGIQISLTTEKSGQKEYQFEYGADFGKHIDKFAPQYAKALVRYNPANTSTNKKQLATLKKLSQFCRKNGYGLLFELLVPPTEEDLKRAKSQAAYDAKLRAELTVQAIQEIQKQVEVDIWKIEGFTKPQWKNVLAAIKEPAKAIILGRGGDKKQVETWLLDAAAFDRVIGFAVGRTIFYGPLKAYIAGKKDRNATVAGIARNFKGFVTLWRRARARQKG